MFNVVWVDAAKFCNTLNQNMRKCAIFWIIICINSTSLFTRYFSKYFSVLINLSCFIDVARQQACHILLFLHLLFSFYVCTFSNEDKSVVSETFLVLHLIGIDDVFAHSNLICRESREQIINHAQFNWFVALFFSSFHVWYFFLLFFPIASCQLRNIHLSLA